MVLKIAHRGASGYKNDNSIEAFEEAIKLNCDWIELDVRITDFDELVICHDEAIMKDNHYYFVSKINSHNFINFGLLTLDDVLNKFLSRINLNIEIKTAKDSKKNQKMLYLIGKKIDYYKKKFGPSAKSILISSFHHTTIKLAHRYITDVDFGFLFSSIPLFWAHYINHCRFTHFIFDKNILDKEIIAELKKKDIKVWVFTCNRTWEIEEMSKFGVDGIISNYPDKIKKY